MSVRFTTTPARGQAITSTCKTCGKAFTHPNYSVHKAWRTGHALECPPPEDGRSAT